MTNLILLIFKMDNDNNEGDEEMERLSGEDNKEKDSSASSKADYE